MISFASFPATSEASGSYGTTRHHPDVEDDVHMDLDEDDFEEGVQRLTVPGESITSSHAFMRYVPSVRITEEEHSEGGQRSWNLC